MATDKSCLCRTFAPRGYDSAYIGQIEHCPIHATRRLCICEPAQNVFCSEALSIQKQISEVLKKSGTEYNGREWVRLQNELYEHLKNNLVIGEA